nr:khg/kdpg aldolase [Quercus suber]
MCSCTWLQSSPPPPPPPPPPRLRACCYSSTQLSVLKTFTHIHSSGVIACLRANSTELALKAARAALSGGISVLEIVMSTPGVFEVLQQLVQEHPTTTLGVGTVLNVEDAKNAINAGAKFLMSPAMVKDIMVDAQCGEVLYMPGVMTPTEILSAYDSGAKIVKDLHKICTVKKVYPISALGGSRYISALKRPFHHISVVASQGITIQSENISPKEHQQLYYLMPYLIRRQLVKIISMKYVDLHTLQLCKAMKH